MAKQEVLSENEVRDRLSGGPAWVLEGGSLAKEVKGRDFAAALAYVNAVGSLAEERNHHPDIAISWNTVRLTLRSHSAGGITEADFELATAIDGLGPPEG